MKAMVLVAHGSRRAESNDEVRLLASNMVDAAKREGYDLLNCAFLELAEPSIPDGIQQVIDDGADEVVVMPYFLSAGRHVQEDIPADVEQAKDKNPEVNIKVLDHLGAVPGLADLIMKNV